MVCYRPLAGLTHPAGLGDDGRSPPLVRAARLRAHRLGGRARPARRSSPGAGAGDVLQQPPVFWALVVCLVVTESVPILLERAGGTQVATTAETFAFAILLGWGTTAATFALVLGRAGGRRPAPGRAREGAVQRRPVRPAHGGRPAASTSSWAAAARSRVQAAPGVRGRRGRLLPRQPRAGRGGHDPRLRARLRRRPQGVPAGRGPALRDGLRHGPDPAGGGRERGQPAAAGAAADCSPSGWP